MGAKKRRRVRALRVLGADERCPALLVTQHAREQVVVADVNGDAASATAAALVAEGIEAVACAGDVGKRADADAFVSAAVRHFGGVDILVANAGIVRAAPFLDMTEEARRTRRSVCSLVS